MQPAGRAGAARVIALDNSAALAGLSYEFPGVEQFRLLAVSFVLSTSAAVAARRPAVSLADSSGVAVATVAAPFTRSAGGIAGYTFGAGLQPFGANDAPFVGGPFVDGWLPGNLTLEVAVLAADAADTLSGVRLLVTQREPGAGA